jgi:hypothetical protein
MSPLDVPPYVLLEIIDWLPMFERAASRWHKVTTILNVQASIRKIEEARSESSSTNATQ